MRQKRVRKKPKTFVLALGRDNPEKELDFELDFQLSLTAAQRYEMMDRLVKTGREFTQRNGNKSTPKIVARS